MLSYVISPNEDAASIHVGDLKAVRVVLRERITKDSRQWCRITLEEYDTSKGTILRMLNGEDPLRLTIKRKWRVGPRGRLIEVDVNSKD